MNYDFSKSLGKLTLTVSKAIGNKLMEKTKNANIDISNLEWSVLAFLYNMNELTQTQISEVSHLHKVAVKRVVDELEKKSLVTRKTLDSDHRYKQVKITEKGKNIYKKVSILAQETLEEAYVGVSKNELEICQQVLEKVLGNVI